MSGREAPTGSSGGRFRIAAAAVLLAMTAALAPGLALRTALSQYGRDFWDSDSGLPQNSVDTILQTSDGYLWLGTQEGLVRFDGVHFTVFDSRNSPAMHDDWVRSLREARDGTLWVGTADGLLRSRNGRFEGWQPEGILSRGTILQVFEAKDGALWVVSMRGLVRLKGRSMRLFGEENGLAVGTVTAVGEDAEGRLWAGGARGLARLEEDVFRSPFPPGETRRIAVTALAADPHGGLWVGTRTGILHGDGDGFSPVEVPKGFPGPSVQAVYVDSEGVLWLGTGGGLLRFSDGRFEALTRDSGGLSSGDVNAIFEDREGSLWIGTRDGGLNRLKDERIANYTTRQGLPEDQVWSVFEDRDETLWVGTADGSLSRLPRGRSRFEVFAQLGARVVSLDQDVAGDLWVGTRGRGLFRIHGGRLVSYGEREGFPATFVSALHADRSGGVWIGSAARGLFFYREGKFTNYTEKDGLVSNAVFCLYQDREGTLWIGTWGGGLSRLRDGKFSNLTTKDGLAHDIVMSILEDSRGIFWFGTRGGLSRWSGGAFTTFRQATGLFHDAVQKVLADDRGYLWMTSNRGIFRVRADELAGTAPGAGRVIHPIGLTTGNGMRNVECNNGQHGGALGWDGRLWFATLKGLAMADPRQIRLNTVPPKVVIERVLSGRRELDAGGEISLSAPMRDLEFQYTALSFRNPAALSFRYRLEGFDSAWIDADGRRTAYYTNLPPGRYTFRVSAENEDGYSSPGGASVGVTLERSLTETAAFRVLLVALLVGLAWVAHRLRAKRMAAGEALRAAVLEARLSSLQSQLKPHFLFNALNSLLPLVGGEPSRARRMIIRIADLLRASLLSETTPLVPLERDLNVLNEYLDVERMRFRDRIRVEVEADEEARSALVPSFLLQPLVENAVKHAADPSSGRVRILIGAAVESGSLVLTIRDDGPGLPPDWEESAGIGLRNIRRRLDLLYPGNHEFGLSTLPGGGCEARIRLPLSSEAVSAEEEGFRPTRVRGGMP
jgi:ligand-binding sensor domain-containing protein/signal transduction histidine kinase